MVESAPETRVIRRPSRIRLLLSGGGNRAILGGAGALAYLVQHGYWEQIDEVVSVSGGSAANAAVLTRGASTYEDALVGIGDFYLDAAADRGQPWKGTGRWGALIGMLTPILVLIYLILTAVSITPGPDVFERPVVGLVVGLLAPPITSLFVRRGAGSYLRRYLGTLSDQNGRYLNQFGEGDRQHVICATGLASGDPYYLWSGGSFFYAGGDLAAAPSQHVSEDLWGNPTQADMSIADAVFASSSLPSLAQVQADTPTTTDADRELLIDGGVSGIFGRQVSAGLEEQGKSGGRLDPQQGHIIVIDSGRHLKRAKGIGALLYRVSLGALLARWLKVSLEANYRRDLEQLDDADLIRIAEGFDENPNTDGVLGRYDELRRQTAQMGLHNYNASRARNAFVTGWVGCALTLEPDCSSAVIEAGLGALGDQMELGEHFVDHWRSL